MPRRVSCIPSADTAFCEAATGALREIDGDVSDDELEDLLAAALRVNYPGVEVHRQASIAHFRDDVWYASRDGKPFVDRPTEPLAPDSTLVDDAGLSLLPELGQEPTDA